MMVLSRVVPRLLPVPGCRGTAAAALRRVPLCLEGPTAGQRRLVASPGLNWPQPPLLWGGATNRPEVGSAGLDWGSLGFDYVPTRGHVRFVWKDGQWDTGTFSREHFIAVHILGNVFHYGQALFEGLKAFHAKDGSVSVFADGMNHTRMTHGARRLHMQSPPWEVWERAVDEAMRENIGYLPPYGSQGSMYIRPFLFGSGPKLGLGPSTEYTFIIAVSPVGSYYRTGTMQSLDGVVVEGYNRAAPLGIGDCKAAGNYAADLDSMLESKKKGFLIGLYLDATEQRYVEEFNTSNFVAITKDGRYITPHAPRTTLRSVTNQVLQKIAEDLGMKVEVRPIDFEAEVDTFAEVGAVGTAVVVTPIASLTRGDKTWNFGEPNVLKQLHDKVRSIQMGEELDNHGWNRKVSLEPLAMGKTVSLYPPL